MIEEQLAEFPLFMESIAKTPSFLKGSGNDRATIIYEDTCGAFVFDATEVWSTYPEKNFSSSYVNPSGEDKLI